MRGTRAAVRSAAVVMVAVVSAPWWETPSFAHRLDELFQAARVTIQAERVVVDLDLTPGIQVAPQLIDLLDANGDEHLSAIEGLNFAREVIRQSALSVDGTVLPLGVSAHDEPAVAVLRGGGGVIHVQAQAPLHSAVSGGSHVVRYRNGFDPGWSLYAANATLPTDQRIVIRGQERYEDQRELAIRFDMDAPPGFDRQRQAAVLMCVGSALLLIGRWRRYRGPAVVRKALTMPSPPRS